jgi:hypothetical protein
MERGLDRKNIDKAMDRGMDRRGGGDEAGMKRGG